MMEMLLVEMDVALHVRLKLSTLALEPPHLAFIIAKLSQAQLSVQHASLDISGRLLLACPVQPCLHAPLVPLLDFVQLVAEVWLLSKSEEAHA